MKALDISERLGLSMESPILDVEIIKMSQGKRNILIGEPGLNFSFPSNYVKTTKYSKITFFPLCLAYQFKRVSNWYFLVIAILQSISSISPLNPFSAIAPLAFVLFVSLMREGVEDFLRYRNDKQMNSLPTQVFTGSTFSTKASCDIRIGDILRVAKDESIPCDLIMLVSSAKTGRAYVETSNLDGEKFLKIKEAVTSIDVESKTGTELKPHTLFTGLLVCDEPNPKLHELSGTIQYQSASYPLKISNALLTGSSLKNTDWIIGVAVYTGDHSKLRQSTLINKYKISRVEQYLNKYIIGVITLELILCIIPAILDSTWSKRWWETHIYLYNAEFSYNLSGFLDFLTYFLLLNTMLPISLIVSLELVKVGQAFFMMHDEEMRSPEHYCKVITSSLNEELGMVQYILTDKTGTLTCNKMEFQQCMIGCKQYSNLVSPEERKTIAEESNDNGTLPTFRNEDLTQDLSEASTLTLRQSYLVCNAEKPLEELRTQRDVNIHFMQCLALCHECLAERRNPGAENALEGTDKVRFISPSPDEVALLQFADRFEFKYRGVDNNIMTLYCQSGPKKFERLSQFDFTSDRKRSSVLVRDLDTRKIYLYCKGADNVIIDRISHKAKLFLNDVSICVNEYSKKGLRTLVQAYKVLEESEYQVWRQKHQNALAGKDSEEEVAKVVDRLERDLFLLGCTGVEDSLQTDVQPTLTSFLQANIKIWMLTGDKMETAENIGYTCGLLPAHLDVHLFPNRSLSMTKTNFMRVYKNHLTHKFALVLEERVLLYMLSPLTSPLFDEETDTSEVELLNMQKAFASVISSKNCLTVICCRVSPGQKRDIVKFVKNQTKAVCLAVGDGANDVAMIKEADVGVGIYGQEGVQAVQASDYALGEFRFLWELILTHGRWNYLRQTRMILYFFYKNFVFTIPQFYFSFYCAYSGQTFYDDWYITLYNMLFTALPLLAKALFEKDVIPPTRSACGKIDMLGVSREHAKAVELRNRYPKVYDISQKNTVFNPMNFAFWIGAGLLHSVIVFFIPLYVFEESDMLNYKGHGADLWCVSITSFTSIMLVVNLKLALSTRLWNKITLFCMFGLSILLYFAYIFIYDQLATTPALYTLWELMSCAKFWFCLILTSGWVIVIDGFAHFLMMNANKPKSLVPGDLADSLIAALTKSKSDQLREKEILSAKGEEIDSD